MVRFEHSLTADRCMQLATNRASLFVVAFAFALSAGGTIYLASRSERITKCPGRTVSMQRALVWSVGPLRPPAPYRPSAVKEARPGRGFSFHPLRSNSSYGLCAEMNRWPPSEITRGRRCRRFFRPPFTGHFEGSIAASQARSRMAAPLHVNDGGQAVIGNVKKQDAQD